MKALRYHRFGGPEVVALEEVAAPEPGPGQIRARITAASINPIDFKFRIGALQSLYPVTLPLIPGRDGAGVIDAIGPDVAGLSVGDPVFGMATRGGDGTHAELALMPAMAAAPLPQGLDPALAASCGVSGMSAWIAMTETAPVKPGMKVLVHAGAGGVGGFAIGIARHRGAEVWATCSAGSAGYVEELGAHPVDYTAGPFERAAPAGGWDVILDSIGGEVHRRSVAALAADGILAWLVAQAIEANAPTGPNVRQVQVAGSRERLLGLATLLAEGRIKPPRLTRFPFTAFREAFAAVESGHARGKVAMEWEETR